MLGDVGRGAAIFAAQREALAEPQRDQQDRRGQPIAVGRQQADRKVARPITDGDEEGIFASDQVADAAEDQAPNGRTRKPAA